MYRYGIVAGLMLWACVLGCLPIPLNLPEKATRTFKPFREPPDRDALYLQTVLLERPLGDELLNQTIWHDATNLQSHGEHVLWTQNGLRVGIISGWNANEFHQAIRSEEGTLQPMHRTFQAGVPRVVPVSSTSDRVPFSYFPDLTGRRQDYELSQIEAGWQVTLHPIEQDRVKLELIPQLQHGDKEPLIKATEDGSEFTRFEQKRLESFSALRCEFTLTSQDFVVLGMAEQAEPRLGSVMYVTARGEKLKQRVLVIRPGRGAVVADPDTVLGR